MKMCFSAGLLLLAGCGTQATGAEGGLAAYRQNKIAAAEAAFGEVIADPSAKPRDKALAHYGVGHIAWHVDRNADKALQAVARADATGEERCETALLEARILREAQRMEEVLQKESQHLRLCTKPDEIDRVRLVELASALDLAASGAPSSRPQVLQRAETLLAALSEDARAGLRGAALALELALVRQDAEGALRAWKNYFWLTDTDVPQGLARRFPSATPLLAAGLAPTASVDDRLALLDLLVTAGFAQQAQRFADATGLPQAAAGRPLWRKASAYLEWRKDLEQKVAVANRRLVRTGKSTKLAPEFTAGAKRLAAAAGLRGDPKQALRDAYGLYGTAGETGGFPSIHLGHIVQSERQKIEQYGHRADVGFLVLDNMVSNGFETWLWDGYAAAGGWTEEGPVIVQVRPEYTSGPLSAWNLYGDTPQRRELLARQKEREASDLEAAKGGGVAYLRGLGNRIQLQLIDQVGARARSKAGPDGDLRRAFLDEYWRANFQQSIFIHEGRHALDRTLVTGLARLSDTNLEYRAKLSELALADYPRLALFNINSATIGGDTGHDKANAKIMESYARWISSHSNEVRGYDPALPPLVQLDRLSDAQLKAIARSLDPIAR